MQTIMFLLQVSKLLKTNLVLYMPASSYEQAHKTTVEQHLNCSYPEV